MTWLLAVGAALARLLAPIWKPLAVALGGYIKGRRDAKTEAVQDAAKRVEKGREAVADGRRSGDDPDGRIVRNDGKW